MPDPLHLLRVLRARFRALLHRDAVADEIREELEFHLRMRAEGYERSGEPPDDAALHARDRVGNLTVLQDRGYDVRGGGFVETVFQDTRYAIRQFARQPGFSVVAILTLALGVGLSTALFSVIDAALLHPLPYPHPEQLAQVLIDGQMRNGHIPRLAPSLDDVRLMRVSGHSLSEIGVWRNARPSVVAGPEPERLEGEEIDEGYLGVYGVVPIVGRGIEVGDMVQGAAPVVLIGYDYWQRRYGGRRDIIGKLLPFDTGSATIVGVLPASFDPQVPFFRPLTLDPSMHAVRGAGFNVPARLRAGVSIESADRELNDLLHRQDGMSQRQTVAIDSLLEKTASRYRSTVNVLELAVALILVIACVNLAALLLARGTARLPELAIRASIGAGRWRLVRQLLTESLLLAVAGGTAGVLLARWSLAFLVANIPMSLPDNAPATVNLRVLAFALGLSLLSGVVFGLAPALRLSHTHAGAALIHGHRGGSTLTRGSRSFLIVAEVALATVLLSGAAIMIRSFGRLMAVDLGFDPAAFITFDVQTVDPSPATVSQYYPALLERIRTLPGVTAAGAIDELPLGRSSSFSRATASGVDVGVALRRMLPGYFESQGLPLEAGRLPNDTDLHGSPVVVIDSAAARRLFAGGSSIGRLITLPDHVQPLRVIGVVGDVRYFGPLVPTYPEIYELLRPADDPRTKPRRLTIVIRPSGSARALASELRQMAAGIGPRVLIGNVMSGEDWLQDTVITPRRRTVLLTLLGALGLLLTLVGVFGITAYSVTRRTQEIGVRMALGAQPRNVLSMLLMDIARPVGLGIALGLIAAALSTKIIASFLFETTPTDAVSFAVVAVVLAVTACIAAWIPSRRALNVDPVSALRAE